MLRVVNAVPGAATVRALMALGLASVTTLSVSAVPSSGQDAARAVPAQIVVGTMRVPPFVLRGDDGQWSGLSIDLWNRIAAELGIRFEYREFDYDLAGLLDAVDRGRIDAAIAAIPITPESERRFDFTHAYFPASLGIAVRTQPQSGTLATLTGLFSRQILAAIATLCGLLLLVGALIWLFERRHRAHFDPRPAHGIADGIWWAAVTMTTTGYGDKVPVSLAGRALGVIWMFASIFLVALFSATLASSFVVASLKTGIGGPDDLARARVAAVTGGAGAEWLQTQGIAARGYPFVIHAIKALQRGDTEALVHEKAILGHMIKEYHWGELRLLPHTLAVRYYAIAVPTDSPLKEPINRALLDVMQRPDWKEVVQRYVGSADQLTLSE
jgi:polar amino acid transport system substrate-binding protein